MAAAARAVRCASTTPAELPALLLAAIRRLRGADDVVTLAPADAAAPVTVLTELFRTLRWLGPRAAGVAAPFAELLSHDQAMLSDTVRREGRLALGAIRSAAESAPPSCCGAPAPLVLPHDNSVPADADIDVAAIALQDQDGSVASFGEIFRGRPSVLTFFYTRCANPNKCSLTIQKLAQLQTLIAEAGLPEVVNVAAISYDGAFDLPHRLRTYGEARGMRFDRFNRMLRTIGDFEPVRRWLDLGVGYGATTVNHHRLDLVVLDRSMRCVERIARRQWNEHELFDIIRRALRNDGNVQT
ncbi:SCO family protein [Rhodopseudomonas palustris]|uniref:SCO family protein n=1 Tax=Rhodopseudomonas palustris TaxID=1076 RepID=UPI0012EDD4F6|nr:SCO family protein [Rhodopseudomonas palustris]